MSTIALTVHGAELLKAELHRLKTVERPAVVNAIAEARAQGDLSENAEYDAAKERQGFVEGRIQDIEAKLSNATVIDPAQLDAQGRVVFGATVTLEEMTSGKARPCKKKTHAVSKRQTQKMIIAPRTRKSRG